MNIVFEYIEVQNFKSVGDPIIINYKDFNGLNFVIGNNLDHPGAKNGSGKSVLLVDCLIFALFGKTAKPTSNQNLINRYYKIIEKLRSKLIEEVELPLDYIFYYKHLYIDLNYTIY